MRGRLEINVFADQGGRRDNSRAEVHLKHDLRLLTFDKLRFDSASRTGSGRSAFVDANDLGADIAH